MVVSHLEVHKQPLQRLFAGDYVCAYIESSPLLGGGLE